MTRAQAEQADIRCVGQVFRDMHEFYNAHQLPALRGEHAKSHGTVWAFFKVLPGLPDHLRQGIFAHPGRYEAVIRFSASHYTPRSDTRRDVHGMAIKVLYVTGPDGQTTTQDFVLASHPTFVTRDASDYCALAKVVLAPKKTLRAVAAVLLRLPRYIVDIALIIRYAFKGGISNPLTTRYWSQTPYRLGGAQFVQYSALPRPAPSRARRACAYLVSGTRNLASNATHDPARYDFLEERMAADLAGRGGSAQFEFQVQVRRDGMPIDDPRVRWSELLSPFHTVAEISIPPQDFRAPARRNFAENLSFTPAHALPEHAPVGAVNDVRIAVYAEISRLRHAINGAPLREPRIADWMR
jgi:hypothetical protein